MAKTQRSSEFLFPIFNQQVTGGLARLARQATVAGERHQVTLKALTVRRILNKSISNRRLSFAYSINPYRGCEFACRYCYARYTHTFFAGQSSPEGDEPDFEDPSLFERLIFLKRNGPWLLEQELRSFTPGQEIAIGTATDPYQPAERSARITRGILEVFAGRRGHRLGIVTKSNLILRDIDLLAAIARHNTLAIHLTITTPDPLLARKLEPRAPTPDLRFDAVRQLRAHGLHAGVLCSPLLPGITDSADQIEHMAELAAAAGASFFAAEPLFLKSCSRPTYLSFVREHFPQLTELYDHQFREHDFAGREYRELLQNRVHAACQRHRIPLRSTDALLTRDTGHTPRQSANPEQASLFP